MQQNHEERKKTARKGIPHHQDELPFDLFNKPETPSAGNNESKIQEDVSSHESPLKDSKSSREQKSRSVIRNRFLNGDEGKTEDSMVKRVVDNLLNEDKDDESSEIAEKEDSQSGLTEPVEEIFAEEEEEHHPLQEFNNDEEGSLNMHTDKDSYDGIPEEEDTAEDNIDHYKSDDEVIEDDAEETMEESEETGDEEEYDEKNLPSTLVGKEEEEEITESVKSSEKPVQRSRLAKEYEKLQNTLEIVDLTVTILAILAFLFLGWSRNLRDWINHFTVNPWIVPLLYAAVITIVYYFVILIPLHAVSYHYENKYRLNTQSFASWLDDQFKSLVVNIIFVGLFLEVTYFLLRRSPDYWWIWAAIFWSFFAILIANLTPVLLIPLFYKLTPLKDDSLKDRLRSLAERIRVKVLNVYEIKLSRKTKKANAMLAGLGNTKRILLGDTLLKNYSGDEIETIIAHELGHHYHRHIYKIILLQTIFTFAGLFIASLFLSASVGWFDYLEIEGVADIAGFPFLLIAIFIFGILTMPLSNFVSRIFERQSDKFALRLTDRPNEFISAMKKIADQNLADKNPSKFAEILFHSHPSISSRISAAEDYAVRKRI